MREDSYTTNPNELKTMNGRKVTADFFRTLSIPVLRGRALSDADQPNTPRVALIDETAAQRYWKGKDPIGGRIRYPWPGWLTVVGVVGTTKNNDLTDQPQPTFYVPFAQYPQAQLTVVARTGGDPAAAFGAIRAAVRELAPDVPVSDERTMTERLADSVAQPRFATGLLVAFGALALLLGAVGTYGLMAYTTQRRTRELAVRMAFGAETRGVLWTVSRGGGALADAAQESRLRGRWDPDPGTRHRFQHGRVQRRERRAAPAVALRRAGSAVHAGRAESSRGVPPSVLSDVPRLAGSELRVLRACVC